MKRILSILLILAMVFPLVACGGDSDGDKNDDPAVTTQKPADTTVSDIYYEPDALPENLDFGGEKVVILSGGREHNKMELTVEELASEPVNDSVYNRELYVEERLNVEIENVKEFSSDAVVKQHVSDSNDYQIYADAAYQLTELIFSGYFIDLYDVEYIDYDKPWWPENFCEAAEIEDKLFVLSGPLSLSRTRNIFSIYFNKSLVEDYKESVPELDDLYGIVESGKWTYDKMTELCGGIYRDLNGNTERDTEDLYGIGYQTCIAFDPFWSGFDINIFSKTDDGWYELDVNTEKLYTGLEKIRYLIHDTDGCYNTGDEYADEALYDDIAVKFSGDLLLFMVNCFYAAEQPSLRNMQSDYGLIPFPKYDESQADYYSYAYDEFLGFSIPSTNPNPDTAGAVLEAMASYAYRDTLPAYLDKVLKGKYMSDPVARKMVDKIVENVNIDTSWLYTYTIGGEFAINFRALLRENDTSYASTYTRGERDAKNAIKTYKLIFSKLEG